MTLIDLAPFTEFGQLSATPHTYPVAGLYHVVATCSNQYGETQADVDFRARDLEVQQHYLAQGKKDGKRGRRICKQGE